MDKHGSFIPAKDLPKGLKPPYSSEVVWRGELGDWRLEAVRIAGDSLVHGVAHHRLTGASHAARLEVSTPAGVKAWAATLPARMTDALDVAGART